MKNCIVKIIDNTFEKNDEGGLIPLMSLFAYLLMAQDSLNNT